MRARLALTFALLASGCGGGSSGAVAGVASAGDAGHDAADGATAEDSGESDASDAGTTTEAGLPVGAPITATAGKWTWIDFPDSTCDDGTPTGIGLRPSSTSDKLIVYLNGGGACWDYATCVTLNTSTHGPYGAAEFAAASSNGFAGTVLDRSAPQNPFKDYTAVFVPYCTGDEHAGTSVTTYSGAGPGSSKTFHHEGHANVVAYLARLSATYHAPGQIVVTGLSAGGGGALFNYPTFRAYWPAAPMMLVDDSMPLLEKDAIQPNYRAGWFSSWNLGAIVDPICGQGCRSDLSLFMNAVAKKYPGDRMALLSSDQDAAICAFYALTTPQFSMDLGALATGVLDPIPTFRHFFVTGQTHTMLASPGAFAAGGMPLWTWLTQMATGDAAWASTAP